MKDFWQRVALYTLLAREDSTGSAGHGAMAKLRFSKRKPFIYDTFVVLTTNKLRALSDDNNSSNKSPRPAESFVKPTTAQNGQAIEKIHFR